MRSTITPSEMKRVEQTVMQKTGVTGEALMERAAAHVASAVRRQLRERDGVTLCLCGTGNNGGDGLAAMRLLAASNERFEGVCWLREGALSPDAERQLKRLQAEQPQVAALRLKDGETLAVPENVACVIDAMFGTGLSRPLSGWAAEWCALSNRLYAQGVPVVAVDIPSGLNGETGEASNGAVRATQTVTFHRPKPGLYLQNGLDYTGEITVGDIGLPSALDDAEGYSLLEPDDFAALLPPRRHLSHKGSYGRVLLWVGKRGMAGAAALSATAALRAGAGLVTVACPDDIVDTVQTLCPCATCVPLPVDDAERAWPLLREACDRSNAVGVGCGLGQTDATFALLKRLLHYLAMRAEDGGTRPLPAVLDADALNLLARLTDGERSAAMSGLSNAILTPHPAEAARLLHIDNETIMRDPLRSALALRERYGAAVVMKGAASVLAAPEGVALNPYGTPAMAKGGSGDALTGVLTALLAGREAAAYSFSVLQAMQLGCGLHGFAGIEAAKRYGERGALATDLCECLGLVGQAKAANQTAPAAPPEKPASPLGTRVTVTVDQQLGSRDPADRELVYRLNYGYVQEVYAERGVWQNAYIYGVSRPVEVFEGEVVAVVQRADGAESPWVVAQKGARPSQAEIARAVAFRERKDIFSVETL